MMCIRKLWSNIKSVAMINATSAFDVKLIEINLENS